MHSGLAHLGQELHGVSKGKPHTNLPLHCCLGWGWGGDGVGVGGEGVGGAGEPGPGQAQLSISALCRPCKECGSWERTVFFTPACVNNLWSRILGGIQVTIRKEK